MSRIQTIELNQSRLKHGALDDPIAYKTDWGPVASKRSGLYDLMLKPSQGKLVAAYTKKAITSAYVYALIGMLLVLIGLSGLYIRGDIGIVLIIFFCGIGVMLVWAGVGYISKKKLFFFDKAAGIFYSRESRETKRIADVHAIQVVSEFIRNMYDLPQVLYYELNLVLKDGTRLNVMKKYRRAEIEKAAEILGEYLVVPIWVASDAPDANQAPVPALNQSNILHNQNHVVKVRKDASEDPIANKVSWNPVCHNLGFNNAFVSAKFKLDISLRTFRINKVLWAPELVALALFFGIFLTCLIYILQGGGNVYGKIGLFVGGFLTLVNSRALFHIRKREIAAFDKGTGIFSLGNERTDFEKRKLSQIHALQITGILLTSSTTLHCYELNIVFHNASRINILQTSNLKQIRQHAEALANFLNVPVLQVSR